ncbi:MAG: nucleotide sugar dehydrogenase [Cyanobium sp.]
MVKSICCIGAGYVGGPSMAVMADNSPGVEINVVDVDKNRIDAWNNLNNVPLPVYEPGLEDVLNRVRGRNLHFSTDITTAIRDADMVFLSVNTPTKHRGHGAGWASDLTFIEKAARQIADSAKGSTIVVERSTLPVRTADGLRKILAHSNGCHFDILSNPEFMAEGTAIDDLQNPDRVLVGGNCKLAVQELAAIYGNWVDSGKIITTNLWSAELAKLTSNAFLAQRISSINAIAGLCEATGADVEEVRAAIGADRRIGNEFLRPGPGFGGSCFKKDLLNLIYLAEHYGLSEVASYWRSVVDLNSWSQKRISQMIVKYLFGTLRDKRIAVLGFAFKADTNDTRESPSIGICRDLLHDGASLGIHDPRVGGEAIEKLLAVDADGAPASGQFEKVSSVESACDGADAVLILTDWSEYRQLDWTALAAGMRRPGWVFDTRRGTNLDEAAAQGLETWEIGRGGIF